MINSGATVEVMESLVLVWLFQIGHRHR